MKTTTSKNKLTAGTRVAVKTDTTPFRRGVVVGESTVLDSRVGETIIVEFDDGHLSKVAVKVLISESEAVAEEKRVQDEHSRLEEEFERTRQQVALKIKEAAQALRVANQLAKNIGVDLQDFYDEVRPLMGAMDAAGWSTSSLSC